MPNCVPVQGKNSFGRSPGTSILSRKTCRLCLGQLIEH
jgi:hypothetical protein